MNFFLLRVRCAAAFRRRALKSRPALTFTFTLVLMLALAGNGCDRTSSAPASAPRPAVDASAGGIRVQRQSHAPTHRAGREAPPLRRGDGVVISFPQPMVSSADLDRDTTTPPVVFTPALAASFRWKSATSGELVVQGQPAPATAYRLALRSELRDHAGQPVTVPDWGVDWAARPFSVRAAVERRESNTIPARPVARLFFSHPVTAAEVARTVTWRDETGRATGSEVTLYEHQTLEGVGFTASPREPLAMSHSYELVVDGTRCAIDGAELPFARAFHAGTTRPQKITWVRAHHQPKLGTFLDIGCELLLADAPDPAHVRTTPAVPIARATVDGKSWRLFGAFQPGVRYRVEIGPDAVRNRAGFALAKSETWTATFGHKRPAVILSRSVLTTPAERGLDVDLVQVNTGPLRWQLARIPVPMLQTVQQRLDEYRALDEEKRQPRTNEFPLAATRLLVRDLQLPVVVEGALPASEGDHETPRRIALTAAQLPGGAYLLEISGPTQDGRVAGNRALLLVNHEFLVWKNTADEVTGRLFDLATGTPVGGAKVRVLDDEGRLLAEERTTAGGEFAPKRRESTHSPVLVVVEREGGGASAHFARHTSTPAWDGPRNTDVPDVPRQWLFSDRAIYRPGETVRVKGIARFLDGANQPVTPAAGTRVDWVLRRGWREENLLSGTTQFDAVGGWEAEIALPAALPLGDYTVHALGSRCTFKVDEFRAPAFAVEVKPIDSADSGPESRVRVLSHYFHGAPNARGVVRWRAVWAAHVPFSADEFQRRILSTSDHHAPDRETRAPTWARQRHEPAHGDARSLVLDGTAVLDANGIVELRSSPPFPAGERLSAASVRWEISVLAPDGQAVNAATEQLVPLARAHPAVSLVEKSAGALEIIADALDHYNKPVPGVPLKLTLYAVAEKSVRENVSAHVVRFRNTPIYTPVWTTEVTAPFRGMRQAGKTGRFVVVAELAGGPQGPRASEDVAVTGRAVAEFAQWDDASFVVETDRPTYTPGETARLTVRAPFAGRAWVTVETDRVLASFDATLVGNAATLEVPVTEAMHPNAFVQIYLYRPGGPETAAERLGRCMLVVRRPETELKLVAEVAARKVEPGETVHGTVTVTAIGQPAAGADLTLFAVDEAVLRYAEWTLPDPAAVFYPERSHGVTTTSGLRQFRKTQEDDPLFQKGFLIGDGSAGWRSRYVRSRFLTLAFWQGSVRADAAGRAAFSFKAPDNLTDYRIVAVAHRDAAFGHGAAHVQVARKLQAEPALPRFARAGDEVELRVILRQNDSDKLDVRATCTVHGATLLDPPAAERTLSRALPAPVVFRARIHDDATRLQVRFTARSTDEGALEDAVEVEVPVRPATQLRREAVAGEIAAAGWSPASALAPEWRNAQGEIDLVVSRSPWLPLYAGLPSVLEYPHGCSEQVSGRILTYALMADFLRALPDGELRAPEYRRRVQEGLARLSRAQLPNGDLPYWPGGDRPNFFATIQTAWAVTEAKRSGWTVSDAMTERLGHALTRIIRRQEGVRAPPVLRAFALMVAGALEVAPIPRVEALELFQQRDALDDDGRAFLALALHHFRILPDEKLQLVAELTRESAARAFEPTSFASSARTAALRLCARATIAGHAWSAADREDHQRVLRALLSSSHDFSTQENLWLLLAFRALVREGLRDADVVSWTLPAEPLLRSADGNAASWPAQALADFARRFENPVRLGGKPGAFLLRATFRAPAPELARDRGIRIERTVRNLTAPARDGSDAAPFHLGDELAVTFRVMSERSQAFVALEEPLPAACETVDPAYYRATQPERYAHLHDGGALPLSHWEKRDDRTLWYFDRLPSGAGICTAIVRVTAAGRFHWPAAGIAPMYDARFSGTSGGAIIVVCAP